ncbi:MAG: tetratricopeptide repeat protein [Crocinitomicaceae bacterium]
MKLIVHSPDQADSLKYKAARTLIWKHYLEVNVDSAIRYGEVIESLGLKNSNQQWLADAYNSLGSANRVKGEYLKAIEALEVCVKINEELENEQGKASALGNLGILYMSQAEYGKALENMIYCKSTFEKLGNTGAALNAMNYIGGIYIYKEEFKKADKTYREALLKARKEKNDMMEAFIIGNIGLLKQSEGDLDSALFYFQMGIEMDKKVKNIHGEMTTNLNVAAVYLQKKDYENSEKYYEICINYYRSLGEKKGVSMVLTSLSEIALARGDFGRAMKLGKEAFDLADEVGEVKQLSSISKLMYELYKKSNNPSMALKMHEIFVEMNDSLRSEEDKKQVLQRSFQYEYEKKVIADSIAQIEKDQIAAMDLEIEKEKTQKEKQKRNFLIAGLVILTLIGGFIFSRLRLISKQKRIIEIQKSQVEDKRAEAELQKEIVESKNQEIMDSINYAKRLQTAILPGSTDLKKNLNNYFLMYKPKDIVAGDFYWLETFGDWTYIAVADCTGHGVPGAMVSVVCSNALTKSLIEEQIADPGRILDRTKELVIQKFNMGEGLRDGMDVSLARINFKTGELEWAGANNNLWIIRNEVAQIELAVSERIQVENFSQYGTSLYELKATKQPVGYYERTLPFETLHFNLAKGDTLYFHSDGLADQFGGGDAEMGKKGGKKLKTKNLKTWVAKFSQYELDKQLETLETNFERWKGDLEQLDDVCMLGIRI